MADLYNVRDHDQVSTQFLSEAIEAINEKHRELKPDWRVMYVRKTELPDATVGAAVDKVRTGKRTSSSQAA